jgi:hypothetical protein
VAAALRARLGGRPPPPAPPPTTTLDAALVDASGRAAAGAFGRDEAGRAHPAVGKRTQRYDPSGARGRWFADDDDAGADVATLAKRARHGDDRGAIDVDAAIAKGILKQGARYRGGTTEAAADDEYDFDGGLAALDAKRAPRRGRPGEADRARAAASAATRRDDAALAACAACVGAPRFESDLVIAASGRAYLAAVRRGRLALLHCVIAPAAHAPSERSTDEDTATDIRNFKKCVLRMHAAAGAGGTLFFETASRANDPRAHARVDAVPLSDAAVARAPAVIRATLEDAADEWGTNHAKRLLDTRGKGLRGSIPPAFPYFHVELGLARGWLHVIDDERAFGKAGVGRALAGGLVGADDGAGRGASEKPHETRAAVAALKTAYDPFDWTKELE